MNLFMLFGFLNNLAHTKYAGITNHNLDNKYFIDTNGSSLVIVVIIIQMNIIYMTMDIGCCAISVSNFLSCSNLAMKKNNTPNSIGSTGTDSDNPMSIPKPSKLIDRGVKNAIKKRTFSYEKRYNISIPNRIGNANIMYVLFSTTRYKFATTNSATKPYRHAILMPFFCKIMIIICLHQFFR